MLGGNLGDEKQLFEEARRLLIRDLGEEKKVSALYASEPWGLKSQPWFVNQALVYQTLLTPVEILDVILKIETKLGRKRSGKNSPRTIDIDILLYGDEVVNTPRLVIPHPRMHLRKFNLVPSAEISPEWVHSQYQQAIGKLLANCDDKLEVKKISQTDDKF